MSSGYNSFRFANRLKRWVALLFMAAALGTFAAEKSYVVKRNDTLYGIARSNGLTVEQLADHNRIPKDTRIIIGQRLVIPSKPAGTNPPTSLLSQPVRKAIDKAPVSRGRWKHVVIHHSGVNQGSLKAIDRYHREQRHMENGLAYHFVIGNGNGMGDGEIGVGRRWTGQLDGGHLRSEQQNKIAIGICLIGNFDKNAPTKKQLESLENLTRALMKRCNLKTTAVKTHQQINVIHTRCPGSKFPTKSFLAELKKPKT